MNKTIKKSSFFMFFFILLISFVSTFIFLQHPTHDAMQYDNLFSYLSFGNFNNSFIGMSKDTGQVPLTFIHFEDFSFPMDSFYNITISILSLIGLNSGMIYFVFLVLILSIFWKFSLVLHSHKKYLYFIALVFNPWILQGLIVPARQYLAMALVLLFIMGVNKYKRVFLFMASTLTHWSTSIFFLLGLRYMFIFYLIILLSLIYFLSGINLEPILIVLDHKMNSQTEMNVAYSTIKFLFHIILLLATLFSYRKDLIIDNKFMYIILLLVVLFSKVNGINPERIVDIFLPLMFIHIFNRASFQIGLFITMFLLLLSCYSIPIIFSLY